MKAEKLIFLFIAAILILNLSTVVFSAVTPEEAAKLGTSFTRFGSEMAGNKEGTIPAYTGGLTKPPADYVPGSGVRPDPFAGEKPLFSVNAQNMNQYADKLTEGTKALMKKFPTFHIDVYKTHRTTAYPEFVLKNTLTNALNATTANDGLSLRNAHAGIPFPIPMDGYEVMWNHLLRYSGRAWDAKNQSYLVDITGRAILVSGGVMWSDFPYYDEGKKSKSANIYWMFRWYYFSPARKAGEVGQLIDYVNMYEKGRTAYLYLPGQRRLKLAPEAAFDTPSPETSAVDTYDESWMFNGSMERYNFKLICKKEMYIPYNTYKANFEVKKEELFGPKHLNPDAVRWELHRVWVVEGTLKPGKRHIYPKRRFYVDEDSWSALACENYDAHGNLFKVGLNYHTQSYDMLAPNAAVFYTSYNLISNIYIGTTWPGEDGYIRAVKVRPERDWAPQTMTAAGIR